MKKKSKKLDGKFQKWYGKSNIVIFNTHRNKMISWIVSLTIFTINGTLSSKEILFIKERRQST